MLCFFSKKFAFENDPNHLFLFPKLSFTQIPKSAGKIHRSPSTGKIWDLTSPPMGFPDRPIFPLPPEKFQSMCQRCVRLWPKVRERRSKGAAERRSEGVYSEQCPQRCEKYAEIFGWTKKTTPELMVGENKLCGKMRKMCEIQSSEKMLKFVGNKE